MKSVEQLAQETLDYLCAEYVDDQHCATMRKAFEIFAVNITFRQWEDSQLNNGVVWVEV